MNLEDKIREDVYWSVGGVGGPVKEAVRRSIRGPISDFAELEVWASVMVSVCDTFAPIKSYMRNKVNEYEFRR